MMKFVRLAALLVIAVSGSTLSLEAKGQALVTASKGSEIGVWGGYMGAKTDFGPVSKKGYAFGANYTLYLHLPVDPSIEVRFDHDSTTVMSQRAILIGPRVSKDFGRIHPYADFLIGTGKITYTPPPYAGDQSDGGVNKTFGVGVDVDVYRNFSVKLDATYQTWNLGTNYFFVHHAGEDYTLSPRTVILGVTYHLPFAGLKKQRELR